MDTAFVAIRKPKYVHIEGSWLHKEDGPAMEFHDGMKVYAYKGRLFDNFMDFSKHVADVKQEEKAEGA